MISTLSKNDDGYKAVKIILLLFVSFTVISYYWVITTGYYNGDYIWRKPKTSQWQLFFNFVITIIPFFVLFLIYRYYKKKNRRHYITIPVKSYFIFILFLLFFKLATIFLYGVGKVGQEIYSAPLYIKLFIQIFNRFELSFCIFLYVSSSKKSKWHNLLYFLLILASISSFSLGIFLYLGIFVIIQYYHSIFSFIKKKFLLVVAITIFFPNFVGFLYTLRRELRSGDNLTLSIRQSYLDNIEALIIGRLVGRISSYSNSAWIIENKNTMKRITADFSIFQYPRESLIAFYGGFLDRKKVSYLTIMAASEGNYNPRYNNMIGTQGALLLGIYQNGLVFIINLATILGIIIITFELASLIKGSKINEILFIYFSYCVISGANYEYMINVVYVFVNIFLFLVINFFMVSLKPRRVFYG